MRHRCRACWHARDERGNAALQMVLLAPLLLGLMLLVVALGRLAAAKQDVSGAADDAARAASLQRDVGLAGGAASKTARADIGQAGLSCTSLQINPDLTNYRPGGQVSVTISCTASLAGVAVAGLPGSTTFHSTGVVPIETWRSH